MSLATLSGNRVTRARACLPKFGCWYADAALDAEVTLAKGTRVELVIADLTLKGAVIAGGAFKGRSAYRIVAGAGRWGTWLPAKRYDSDFGVRLDNVLGDAANEAGETLDAGSVDRAARVGTAFPRLAGPAVRVLEQLVPQRWYVGEDGITRVGARAASSLPGAVTIERIDRARGVAVFATESIAAVVPGVVVDGLEAVDVQHEISAEGGLRSTIWGAGELGPLPRSIAAWKRLLDLLDPNREYRAPRRYRIVSQEGERLNLQPVRASSGMPELRRVRVWPGLPGCKAEHNEGSQVIVQFLDGDPASPVVTSFEDADAEGFVPDELVLAGGSALVARVGDKVSCPAGLGTIQPQLVPSKVKA